MQLPVKLKVHDSVFVPLAKWAMLLTGNYVVSRKAARSIRDSVHSTWVCPTGHNAVKALCVRMGRRAGPVPFGSTRAAEGLLKPSSAARAVDAGAPFIERVDCLVRIISGQHGVEISGRRRPNWSTASSAQTGKLRPKRQLEMAPRAQLRAATCVVEARAIHHRMLVMSHPATTAGRSTVCHLLVERLNFCFQVLIAAQHVGERTSAVATVTNCLVRDVRYSPAANAFRRHALAETGRVSSKLSRMNPLVALSAAMASARSAGMPALYNISNAFSTARVSRRTCHLPKMGMRMRMVSSHSAWRLRNHPGNCQSSQASTAIRPRNQNTCHR